jgi:CBS domain-containing protein
MLATRAPALTVGHTPLVTIPPYATLLDVAGLLHEHEIGAVAVMGPHGLVGVVSERDIVHAVARKVDLATAAVEDHLSQPVMTVRPEDTVLDVALRMLDAATRHLPVVDDLDRPQGMISLRDLLRPLVLQAMTPADPPS